MLVPLTLASLASSLYYPVRKCALVCRWCWGLDFETWDGCSLVCVSFASAWQSNMEDVNYGMALAGVPWEHSFWLFQAWIVLLTFSVSLQSRWASAALDTWHVLKALTDQDKWALVITSLNTCATDKNNKMYSFNQMLYLSIFISVLENPGERSFQNIFVPYLLVKCSCLSEKRMSALLDVVSLCCVSLSASC